MDFKDISLPEVYKESMDFRFFINWISLCLSQTKFDTENLLDLLDPERCPKDLLWMLADTFGFKYDDRLLPAFNRLVLLYFMSMIRNRGSRTGVMLAAEVNLAQFNLNLYATEDDIYQDKLKDTTIPVNSAYVTEHTSEGYIDIVYYSENNPIDACLEYVRPLGMYCFARPGVGISIRTKVSIDAKLTDSNNIGLAIGPTRVGHYRRTDYAAIQPVFNNTYYAMGLEDHDQLAEHTHEELRTAHWQSKRHKSYYRNRDYEEYTSVNAGYRSLASLQLCNNEHTVKALMPSGEKISPIFYLGASPEDVEIVESPNYYKDKSKNKFNLLYDYTTDQSIDPQFNTIDIDRSISSDQPRPKITKNNMATLGDAIMSGNSHAMLHRFDNDTLNNSTHGRLRVEELSEEEEES